MSFESPSSGKREKVNHALLGKIDDIEKSFGIGSIEKENILLTVDEKQRDAQEKRKKMEAERMARQLALKNKSTLYQNSHPTVPRPEQGDPLVPTVSVPLSEAPSRGSRKEMLSEQSTPSVWRRMINSLMGK